MDLRRWVALVCATGLSTLLAGGVAAETVVLKSGKVLAGTIQSREGGKVVIETQGGLVTVPQDEVLAISNEGAPPPKTVPQATTTAEPEGKPEEEARPAEGGKAPPAAAERPGPRVVSPRGKGREGEYTVPTARREYRWRAPARERRPAERRAPQPVEHWRDRGAAGVRVLLSPYALFESFRHKSGTDRTDGEPAFSAGLALFAEGMTKYFGGGLELLMQFPTMKQVCTRNGAAGEDVWACGDAVGSAADRGIVLMIWPYMKIRVPTQYVDPYITFRLGYAYYSNNLDTDSPGPFNGLAVGFTAGLVVKPVDHVGITIDGGYTYCTGDVGSIHTNVDYRMAIHYTNVSVGLMYRF